MITPMHLSLTEFQDSERPHLPKILFRRFKEQAYADLFLDGEIIIRNLLYYRGEEGEIDPRSDPLEGMHRNRKFKGAVLQIQKEPTGPYITVGTIESYMQTLTCPDRFYVYCFSTKKNNEQEWKFGRYVVKIHDTNEFIKRITNGILERKHMCWGSVKYYNEKNDFNEFICRNVSEDGIPIWMMKPDRFSDEYEFRIAIERDDVEHFWIAREAGAQHFDNRSAWQKALSIKLLAGNMRDIASIVS